MSVLRHVARLAVPRPVRARLRTAMGRTDAALRARRRPRWGNLRRRRPFSERYGFDRGTPIDRTHLHRFFAANASDITGRVLEVKDPTFTSRYGTDVERIDLVDIDPTNPAVTLLADLAEVGSLPAASYDCIVVPQTLQYVSDPGTAIANVWQALRPGGVALVSVPSIAPADPELADVDRWRLTPRGLASLVETSCPGAEVSVTGFGNLVTSIGFLHGLAAEELTGTELDATDGRYPILACARVRRPLARETTP